MIESNVNQQGAHNGIRSNLVLIGLVILFFAFNAATSWLFDDVNESLGAAILGVFVFQPIAFGMWAALGSGSTLLNVPLAVPCLMLLIVAATGLNRNGYADVQRSEFLAFAATGFTIFAVATLLFLAVRRRTRLQIESKDSAPHSSTPGLHFSIRFLLALMTLYAFVLAILVRLSFQTESPPQSFVVFQQEFLIRVLAVGGATLFTAVLPTLAVPLLILYGRASKRVLQNAIVFWVVATMLLVGIWGSLEGGWLDTLKFLLLVQLGAVVAGAISAFALRRGGFRLLRRAASPQSPLLSP